MVKKFGEECFDIVSSTIFLVVLTSKTTKGKTSICSTINYGLENCLVKKCFFVKTFLNREGAYYLAIVSKKFEKNISAPHFVIVHMHNFSMMQDTYKKVKGGSLFIEKRTKSLVFFMSFLFALIDGEKMEMEV